MVIAGLKEVGWSTPMVESLFCHQMRTSNLHAESSLPRSLGTGWLWIRTSRRHSQDHLRSQDRRATELKTQAISQVEMQLLYIEFLTTPCYIALHHRCLGPSWLIQRGPSSSRYFGTRRRQPRSSPRAGRSYDDTPYYQQILPTADFDVADVLWTDGPHAVAENRLRSSCDGIHQRQGNGLIGGCRS